MGQQLLSEVAHLLPLSMKGKDKDVLIIVHIYASFERLGQALPRDNPRKAEFVSHFIRGFNSVNGTMDFVDVGDEGGLISKKISRNFSF